MSKSALLQRLVKIFSSLRNVYFLLQNRVITWVITRLDSVSTVRKSKGVITLIECILNGRLERIVNMQLVISVLTQCRLNVNYLLFSGLFIISLIVYIAITPYTCERHSIYILFDVRYKMVITNNICVVIYVRGLQHISKPKFP